MSIAIQRRYPSAPTPRGYPGDGASAYWWEYAECREADPELFYGSEYRSYEGRKADEHEAKLICARCQVWRECLQEALRSGECHGIWGGLTQRERKKLKRAAARATN